MGGPALCAHAVPGSLACFGDCQQALKLSPCTHLPTHHKQAMRQAGAQMVKTGRQTKQ